MKKIQITKKQLQTNLKLKHPVEASGIMNLLVRLGIAKDVGLTKKEDGQRGGRLYEVPKVVSLDLSPQEIVNETEDVEEITASEVQEV